MSAAAVILKEALGRYDWYKNNLSSVTMSSQWTNEKTSIFNRPFPASFSSIWSYQQLTFLKKIFPINEFELHKSGFRSDRSAN